MKMKDSFSANDLDLVLTYLKLGGYRLIDISIEKKNWSIVKAFSKTLKNVGLTRIYCQTETFS